MSEIIFDLKDVCYSYLSKFPALCEINMQVRRGEKISIIGANGTGKSTLLHLLDCLLFADKGRVEVFGKKIDEQIFEDKIFSRDFRKSIGFIFQNPEVQLFCPSVKEDIVFAPLQFGVPHDKIRENLERIADELDIKHLLDRAPHQLSIGEKRKVAIASVLIIDPEVILFDEPTAGLDPLTSRHIVDIIVAANKRGRTIITSTHDVHILEEISDTVYVFDKNKTIARSGVPHEILADEDFLRKNNIIHVHSHEHNGKTHIHSHKH